jgi:hypothetical protein
MYKIFHTFITKLILITFFAFPWIYGIVYDHVL